MLLYRVARKRKKLRSLKHRNQLLAENLPGVFRIARHAAHHAQNMPTSCAGDKPRRWREGAANQVGKQHGRVIAAVRNVLLG